MSDDLRRKLIRLAHTNPGLRPHLLPLLTGKTGGDVVPFRPPVRNTHTVTLAGDKYVLSTDWPGGTGDLLDEQGDLPNVVRVKPTDPWKYLWAYDTDKQVLAMWRVTDGNQKEYGNARSQGPLVAKLDKVNQLNRVDHTRFLALDIAMQKREEANHAALEAWVEELKTENQRTVDRLVQVYFDQEVRPAMDEALNAVEQGVTPLGFKANPGSFPVDRQMKSYVTGKLYDRLFTRDRLETYLKGRGVDLDLLDSQVVEWAQQDVWLAYAKSVLR